MGSVLFKTYRPFFIFNMKTELIIISFTFLGALICFVTNKYYEQKLLNKFLKKKFNLLYKIRVHKSIICKRHSHLDRYDFQLYNLKDSLFEQDYPDFEKNSYF